MWKKNSKPRLDPGQNPGETSEDVPDSGAILREIRNRAIGLLARREHSRAELLHKLSERGFEQAAVVEILEELARENLQSDERYAESYVYSRVQRGQGPQRIRADLRERGVSDNTVEEVIADADADWFELALLVWRKRFGEPAENYSARAKQARFLQNRGFGHEHIQYALASGKELPH